MSEDTIVTEEQVTEAATAMFRVGMKAQQAAMLALVRTVEAQKYSIDQIRLTALAGAIAFTQWKLDSTIAAIKRAQPEFAQLIEDARSSAHEIMDDRFEQHIVKTAAEHGITLGE